MIPPRTLNTPRPPEIPTDLRVWKTRAEQVRRRLRFATGLDFDGPRSPMSVISTGKLTVDGIEIEKVALETWPGFWLAGNVYKSVGARGKLPAVLNAHGHWADGRLTREADVAPPAPGSSPAPGRADLVALAANLARNGCLVFAYDMVGFADTTRVGHDYANSLEDWLWGVSLLGLQTWNSVRALDYLVARPDVDAKKIGITGASGGATQAFLLSALDSRVAVSAPVNMVSHTMQGGCLCENAPGLRVGTDNVEIAALFAPKPQLLVSCDGDWTRQNPSVEVPAIRKVYELFGRRDALGHVHTPYQHNYNRVAREAVYGFFAHTLLGRPDSSPIPETPFVCDPARLRVWDQTHPAPKNTLDSAALAFSWRADFKRQAGERRRASAAGDARAKSQIAEAVRVSLAVTVPRIRRSRSGRTVTVLVAPTTLAARAEQKATELRADGASVTVLVLPDIDIAPADLWRDYFSTYNRTPIGDRVQSVVDAIAKASTTAGTVHRVGVGDAGLWVALADLALAEAIPGKTDADPAGVAIPEELFLRRAYAPGLRAAIGPNL